MALYDHPINTLDGTAADLHDLEGKAVLAVNVASKCGLTPQYTKLEELQKAYEGKGFTVVGFPCNQFMGQEPGSAEEIQEFCSTTYGVTFPLYEKIDVNGDDRHPIYADLTQTAEDLAIRFVDRGKSYPRPIGALDRVTFIGAGYPDYPWLFATDGEYTAYAAVALGQFEPIKDHLIALQQVSDRLNAKSGKVAHEIVTDGSVYFGSNTDPGNTDESVKFPSAVALVWRWSGDNRFLNRLYDFSRRAMRYVVDNLDADKPTSP